jgi:uncharacterized protein UPF0164
MTGSRDAGRARSAVLGLACALLLAPPARALTDEEIFRGYPFSGVPSGARALGMGGAFAALADDASAVEANPAGLSAVVSPLLYFEYGAVRNEPGSLTSSDGNLDVNPVTGERGLPFLSLASSRGTRTSQVPALVGFSWPFTLGAGGRRMGVAISRQVIYSEDVSLPSSGGGTSARFSFDSFPNTVSGGQVKAYSITAPVTGDLSGEIVNWNALVSAEVTPDFSVGATLTHATIDMTASTLVRVEDPLQILAEASHPRLPGQTTADIYRTRVDGSDSDLTYALGVLWHPRTAFAGASSPWQFGASFRKGARLGVEESTELNGLPDRRFRNVFAVPDVYAVGAAYRPEKRWTIGAEIERVAYSDLLRGFRSGVNYLTSPHLATGAFATRPHNGTRYMVDDGSVFRLGGEYLLPLRIGRDGSLALRAGWFRTPDMQIRMTRFDSTDPGVNSTYKDAFPEGSPENHFTLGVGVTWERTSIQMGYEKSDISSRLLASFAYGIGRK